MAILLGQDAGIIVQGITGRQGSHFTEAMIDYGTPIVAGVTPGKGGGWHHGVPVFDSVQTAIDATGATASVIYVNPQAAADAVYEAIDAGLRLVVCVTNRIPIHDAVRIRAYLRHSPQTRLIGPSSPGLLIPQVTTLGIIPLFLGLPGDIGIISRGASLAFDLINQMAEAHLGQSAFIGLGTDAVVGTSFSDALALFEDDLDTRAVVMIGEIGGTGENDAAEYIRSAMTKPVIAYIPGQAITQGTRLGHGGAIISTRDTTAQAKIDALASAGTYIARTPESIIPLLARS